MNALRFPAGQVFFLKDEEVSPVPTTTASTRSTAIVSL
jgi:hypothetical protein